MNSSVNFLDRTLRLIREELVDGVGDETILNALSSMTVLVRSDVSIATCHSGQTAIVTASLLMARCGLSVWVDVPDVELKAPQPPLHGRHLASALEQFSEDLGGLLHISRGQPIEPPALILKLSNVRSGNDTSRELQLSYGGWWGGFGSTDSPAHIDNPFGAMASAALAAAEALKHAMRRLESLARNPEMFGRQFASSSECKVSLVSENTELVHNLEAIDIVSAGAVSNAVLFALLRIPEVSGTMRVIEPQYYDNTNQNRCMLMTGASAGRLKAVDVADFRTPSLSIIPIVSTLQEALLSGTLDSLAERVIVGVDDIPTRWEAQLAAPSWLSIGATTHWSAMSSFHFTDGPCARCLHPRNDDDGAAYAPTISFVSFWAGLWSAAYLIRSFTDDAGEAESVFLTPTRIENNTDIWKTAVPKSKLCPVHGLAPAPEGDP